MKQSVITEAINIIGNAFISVIANQYGWNISLGMPELMNAQDFDAALVSLVSTEEGIYQTAYQCKFRVSAQPIVLFMFILI